MTNDIPNPTAKHVQAIQTLTANSKNVTLQRAQLLAAIRNANSGMTEEEVRQAGFETYLLTRLKTLRFISFHPSTGKWTLRPTSDQRGKCGLSPWSKRPRY